MAWLRKNRSANNFLAALKNQRGQSLIQVMVVAAIGSIIALAMMSLMSNMGLGVNGIKYRSDANNFNEEIRALLSSPQACTNSFGGLVVNAASTFNIATLFDGSPAPGVVTYSTGGTYGDRSLLLQSMVFAKYVAGGAPNTAQMTLTNVLATAKEASGPGVVSRSINITIQFDATNTITSCIALAKMSDGIWQRSQANPNNIFFNASPGPPVGGKVGIGTLSPGTMLEVAGGIKPGSATTGASCAGNVEGSFGYDATAHAPVFCNNTGNWTAMGGPAAGTAGSPCTSISYPSNKGVTLFTTTLYGSARFCCGDAYYDDQSSGPGTGNGRFWCEPY